MDNYPRLFIKVGLMYALLGAALGVTIAVEPSLSFRLRLSTSMSTYSDT
jgi:hypothetical protein